MPDGTGLLASHHQAAPTVHALRCEDVHASAAAIDRLGRRPGFVKERSAEQASMPSPKCTLPCSPMLPIARGSLRPCVMAVIHRLQV